MSQQTREPTPESARELAETVREEGYGPLADWIEDNADRLEEDES